MNIEERENKELNLMYVSSLKFLKNKENIANFVLKEIPEWSKIIINELEKREIFYSSDKNLNRIRIFLPNNKIWITYNKNYWLNTWVLWKIFKNKAYTNSILQEIQWILLYIFNNQFTNTLIWVRIGKEWKNAVTYFRG